MHSRFEWKLSENWSFTRQTWGKPRFRLVHAMMVNTALYLMSDTTIWHYIVPDIKEEILIYNNPLSNLFCLVGCANSLTNAFSGNSSFTITHYLKKRRIWHTPCTYDIMSFRSFFVHPFNCRSWSLTIYLFIYLRPDPMLLHQVPWLYRATLLHVTLLTNPNFR